MRPRRALAAALCVPAALVPVACGSSGADGRDEALAALQLATEAANLRSEMGKLVGDLGSDPSARTRRQAQRRLVSLDREAAELIASAEADSTYEVELRPLNGSGAVGVATLVESDGKVAIDGSFDGIAGGHGHAVAIHALAAGQGPSVCPPANAAAGGDGTLSAGEAEDFYGRPAVRLGTVDGAASPAALTSDRPAAGSPPLDVRAVVLSGGSARGGYRADLPVACGVPAPAAPAPAEASPSSELVAATNETRAAGVDLADVVEDPTGAQAARARRSAASRLSSAGRHLHLANRKAVAQLQAEGEVSSEDRDAVAQANASLDSSQATVRSGFRALGTAVVREHRERRERRRREAQRRVAQAEREASEESASAAPTPTTPEPAPEPAPAPAPEPAPEPTPSAPEGPSIVHPG